MAKKAATRKATSKKQKWPHYSDDPAVQAHYEECRKNGCDHKMADMLASRKVGRMIDTYSPMHPRRGRGNGGFGRPKNA
jgi:hypothetical protein